MTPGWQKWENRDPATYTLTDHVIECELRYQDIDTRLKLLEEKVDKISDQIEGFKTFTLKLTVRLGIGVITTLCATVFMIKM